MSCANVSFTGVNTPNTKVSQTHPTPHATGSWASPQSPILLLLIPPSQSQVPGLWDKTHKPALVLLFSTQLKKRSVSLGFLASCGSVLRWLSR